MSAVNIRPVTDLRSKFNEIEADIKSGPVFLTKNGYGSMVLMSLEKYSDITAEMENKLMEADLEASADKSRYSLNEAFDLIRRHMDEERL